MSSIAPADIAAALGRPAPAQDSADYEQWSMWINDALMLIEARLGDPSALNPTRLDYVVREAVVAMVRRPDDSTQVDVAVDDGRVSKRYSSGSGRVTIRDEWWALLDPDGGDGSAFAVDTYTGADRRHGHSDICSIFFGSPTCSCGAYLTLGQYPLYETWHGGVFPL